MCNSVLEYILDAARTRTNDAEEFKAWYAQYEALEAKIDKLYPELNNEFFDVVWQGTNTRGELMFRLGWELRGNPTGLFDLPEPD